jgi:uncharacterized phage protein (TIGR01671 family)
MKREIKFRALYDGVWYYQTLVEILTITLASFRLGEHKTQFTGLHDKTGKEIYEGDILAYKWEDRDGDEIVNHVIKWDNGRFLMCPIKSVVRTWNIHLHPYDEESEVIGNIYENPELINNQ